MATKRKNVDERRERFALAAMAALIRKVPCATEGDADYREETFAEVAGGAVCYADALIDALDESRA